MRTAILVLLAALPGCGPPQAPRSTPVSLVARQHEWQECLKHDIEPRVADAWASSAVQRLDLATERDIITAALEKCFPSEFHRQVSSDVLAQYGYMWGGRYEELFADEVFSRANAPYVAARDAAQNELWAKKAAENQAALKREEPALWAELHTCAFEGAARLALVSDESAETIVAATFAACRPQRAALIELHQRYGDTGFTDALMDKVEARVAGALVLEVIRARAVKSVPPSPPLPTLSPSKPEQSI